MENTVALLQKKLYFHKILLFLVYLFIICVCIFFENVYVKQNFWPRKDENSALVSSQSDLSSFCYSFY